MDLIRSSLSLSDSATEIFFDLRKLPERREDERTPKRLTRLSSDYSVATGLLSIKSVSMSCSPAP